MGLDCKHKTEKKSITKKWNKETIQEDQEYCKECNVWESKSKIIYPDNLITLPPCKTNTGTETVPIEQRVKSSTHQKAETTATKKESV